VNRLKQLSLGLVFAVLLSATMGVTVQAQSSSGIPPDPESSDPGFHITIVPYLWFSGVHGTVGVDGHDASIDASASDVLSNFDIGFLAGIEPRYNRVVFPVDIMWIKLSNIKGLPFDQGFESVKATLTETIVTQKAGYRIVDQERFKVDTVFGYRYWHIANTLKLQPNTIGNGFSASRGWVDAVAGFRSQVGLNKKAFITVFADAGGGSAKVDYQAGGALGFRVGKKWTLQAGYRYLAVDYGSSAKFLDDIAMSGVFLGATWTPK
jgi:hypothetical protein